jgi:hypothetical protein
LALFVCVVAPTTLVWIQIVDNPKFSPVDETAHFDYVDRVAAGEVPRQGERLLQSSLRELACRKTSVVDLKSPPCGTTPLRYEQFTATYQHEAQQPPPYYAITLPLRWLAQNVVGIDDKLRATRATSIVWLVVGLLLVWTAGRVMAVDPLPLGASMLLLVVGPNVVYHTATVSNDVTAVPAAGLVALVAALAYRRDGPHVPIALAGAGFAAAALKTTNLFPVLAISGAFAVAALADCRPAGPWSDVARRWMRTGGGLAIGGLTAAALWAVIHRTRALIDLKEDPTFEVLRAAPRTFHLVVREAAELLQPLGRGALSDTLSHAAQVPFFWGSSFLLIAAGMAGLFVSPRRWPHVLGLIAVPLLYVGGVVFGVGLMITYDIDPALSGRYGLAMAPLLVLVLAASLIGRWAQRLVAAFAACSFLTILITMIG